MRNFNTPAKIPPWVNVISILLVFDGLLALMGCLLFPGDNNFVRLSGAIGSAVVIGTGASMLINHQAALPLSLLCAILLTIDSFSKLLPLHDLHASAHAFFEAARTAFNIGLYWTGFFLYKKWRSATGTQFVPNDPG